jgi:2'-5' RNA ligase
MTLELNIDASSLEYFNALRKQFFPKHKLKDEAHITLLYQIHDQLDNIKSLLDNIQQAPFDITINTVQQFPNGNAIQLESHELLVLHQKLKKLFYKKTSRRDLVKYRPHITVQLGVTNFKAIQTHKLLCDTIKYKTIKAMGMTLWDKNNGAPTILHQCTFT